ncbi:MAG: hypothetical protein AB7F40_08350 [Victivallaceae bacterium]|nr:hypothetical protein [Victivallaceae bacterium]
MKEFWGTYGNLISAFIIIVGWWIVAKLDRKNAIAIERTKHRIEALKTIIDMGSRIHDNGFSLKGIKIDVGAMQQYSYNIEWKLFEEFTDLIQVKNYDGRKASNILDQLIARTHKTIRRELGYKKKDINIIYKD